MFPCEMARYIAGFSREARKSGRFRWFHHPSRPAYGVWTSTTHPQLSRYGQTPKNDSRSDRRQRSDRLRSQHLGTFGGHFLAAAGGAGRGGGGAAGRGGGGAGRAIWGAGRGGGGGAARGGGGAAIRGGGGAGLAICGAGRGGGGGGAARRGGSAR